jgi:hypothetical protein
MNYYLLYEVVLLMIAAPSKNGYLHFPRAREIQEVRGLTLKQTKSRTQTLARREVT